MTNRRCFPIIALLCVAWLASSVANAQQAQDNERAEKLRSLLVERRDTLKKRLEFVQAMHKHGTADVRQLLDAWSEFLNAELDLASKRNERAELYRKRIDFLREIEKIAREQHKNGDDSIEQLLLATAARLQAEIDIFREQASDAKREHQPDESRVSEPQPEDVGADGQVQAAKTYPVWEGEWEQSQGLNELLGYQDGDLRANEWPSSFRLSLGKTTGDGIDAELLKAFREVFGRIEHRIVATGKWEIAYKDASGASKESGYETSCFVTEREGATFLWVPVPFAILYGGKVSYLEGVDRDHDAFVIDFNTMPKHLAGVVRASDTVAYKRRAEKQ